METGIVEQKASTLAAPLTKSWGSSGVRKSDIIIPKFLIMQGTSELVGDEKKAAGDIVNSLTEETVGGPGKKVEFIPIITFSEWRVMELQGQKYEFKEKFPLTAENEGLPWEDERDGVPIRNDKCLNFFAVRPGDLSGLPVLLSFTRTGYSEGKRLATHFQLCDMQDRPVACKVWGLETIKEKKDTNTYYVPKLSEVRDTSEEELEVAFRWWQELRSSQVRVHEEDVPF